MVDLTRAYDQLAERLRDEGRDLVAIERALATLQIETPSWGYGDSGTRFAVFSQPGLPRDAYERIDDAAEVHRVTGTAPTVALHFPWDQVDEVSTIREHAHSVGLRIGAVNSNLFQDPDYKLGSVAHPDERVRAKAVSHLLECVGFASELGSTGLSIWLADGTNDRGQDDLSDRRRRLIESLGTGDGGPGPGPGLPLEYKP